ncbi:MAG: hypothetical protein Q7S65_05285 [Nanoarchaeota archaeon]|nr:hypothetical protein [Nanoarchaeota archaeon]
MAKEKTRGGWLTFWLWAMVISNGLTTLMYLLFPSLFQKVYPAASSGVFMLLGGLSLVGIISALALLQWKKWGFYANCGIAIAAFFINSYLGIPILFNIAGLVTGPLILYLSMRSRWNLFE